MSDDTIAAIATGMTQAGIGIIRISGENAIAVADRLFISGSGKSVGDFASHTMHIGYIKNTDQTEEDGVTDEVLLSVMRAPHSYTGEDTVEINCHGGIYLCRKILDIVLSCGARLAEPGEFTKRAFLNGRMDLSQAEAVMDLIASKNEFAVKNSMQQLSGAVRDKIVSLREKILHEIAFIESALDDPEHFDLQAYPEELSGKIKAFLSETGRLLLLSENGRIRRDGIRTAILGKPNAGKSSILNLLSGHESAIVTDIAGTTRDTIEESVRMGSLQLNLIDTAGIRRTEDKVEQIGVERARAAAEEADLILYVVDSSVPLSEEDEQIIPLIHGKKTVILYNKTDLKNAVEKEQILSLFETYGADKKTVSEQYPVVEISAKTQNGLTELQKLLEGIFIDPFVKWDDEVSITNLRQKKELEECEKSLTNVLESIDAGMAEDFFSIDLMDAYKHLGFIIGEEVEDDLVEKIFSEFCMGK
ncbi:MAG: tRNA uridine-5-carboxymethylaminomethyl(34) synthesis GTPase MnmE [Lachnospiraceae bacterium]|nr:tRNA uridine-5-carboxymethylaminomethyl(34) synthesis GTPase MnmE [Lachnospiraceae bacterium]